MKPLRPRYRRIERLVLNLLASNNITTAPVPIEKFVKRQKVSIKYGDLGDVSGLLLREGSLATIGVNSSHPHVRQRFTIAHEFGHFLLHTGIIAHCDRDYRVNYRSEESSQATNVEEIEANFFAATLLMPRPFLDQQDALMALDDDRAVRVLAHQFDVSGHAMSLRLANIYGNPL